MNCGIYGAVMIWRWPVGEYYSLPGAYKYCSDCMSVYVRECGMSYVCIDTVHRVAIYLCVVFNGDNGY